MGVGFIEFTVDYGSCSQLGGEILGLIIFVEILIYLGRSLPYAIGLSLGYSCCFVKKDVLQILLLPRR
jgi:hypothetical protein